MHMVLFLLGPISREARKTTWPAPHRVLGPDSRRRSILSRLDDISAGTL